MKNIKKHEKHDKHEKNEKHDKHKTGGCRGTGKFFTGCLIRYPGAYLVYRWFISPEIRGQKQK